MLNEIILSWRMAGGRTFDGVSVLSSAAACKYNLTHDKFNRGLAAIFAAVKN